VRGTWFEIGTLIKYIRRYMAFHLQSGSTVAVGKNGILMHPPLKYELACVFL